MFSLVVVAHALAGAVALVSLWVPIVARKGGDAHRRAGRVYAYAMGAVSLTALVACTLRVIEGDPERVRFAALLALVALLAAENTWYGLRALRRTESALPGAFSRERVVAAAMAVVGAAGVVGGIYLRDVLLAVFGALSVRLCVAQLRALRVPPPDRLARIREHLVQMLAASIATVTAFLVVNYGRAPEGFRAVVPGVVVWLAPTVLGSLGIALWSRRYRAR